VFIPTTPNPTGGYVMFLPRAEVRILSMSIEDAAKLVISGGIVTPDWQPAAPIVAHEPEPDHDEVETRLTPL
jgi:uncharacterized membrane protein